jgi:hypothetical protein
LCPNAVSGGNKEEKKLKEYVSLLNFSSPNLTIKLIKLRLSLMPTGTVA